MILAPPSSDGAVHESRIEDSPTAVAERFVGARGGTLPSVVALATLDGLPVPAELMAETR